MQAGDSATPSAIPAADGTPGKSSLDALMPGYYAELRRLARACLSGERSDHTLQPTALVHEAYLWLARQHQLDWSCRPQVLRLAATMMRRILLNHARSRRALKRDAGRRIELTSALDSDLRLFEKNGVDFDSLDAALTRLEAIDPRQARVVELRFFSGLNIDETASALGISSATVKREWLSARLFLAREIEGAEA